MQRSGKIRLAGGAFEQETSKRIIIQQMNSENALMTIVDCRTYLVDLPLKTKDKYGAQAPFPFGVSYGTAKGLKRVFLELIARRSDGREIRGYGEASPLYPYSNETPLSVYELLTLYYTEYLKSQRVVLNDKSTAKRDLDQIIEHVEKYLSSERLNFTQTAIDYALHDLVGRALGIPVYELLTSSPNLRPVRACWSTSSKSSIDENVREAERFNSMGYAIKIKLNGAPEEDALRTTRILEALSDKSAAVRSDANASYTPEAYLEYARLVERTCDREKTRHFNFYIEEPIDTRKFGKQAFIDLLAKSPYRLMADETLYTLQDATFLAEESRKRDLINKILFNVKIQKVGGLRNAMKVAQLAQANNIPIMIGGMFPSSYGKLANCHYAIALGEVLDSDGVHPSRDYIDEENSLIYDLDAIECMENGYRSMEVFQNRPGFGVQVNMDLIERNLIYIDLGKYYPDFGDFKI